MMETGSHRMTDTQREAELFEAGRMARARVPRSAFAGFTPNPHRNPIAILQQQHLSRLPDLVPLRVERMSASPFAFYRGTAAVQAADLAREPTSGANVVMCGDAHVNNFGVYRSPEGAMVFDSDDFDEAFVGPWEWDVKRLVTSVVLAGRSGKMDADLLRRAVESTAAAYRDELRRLQTRPLYERYFTATTADPNHVTLGESSEKIAQILKKAGKRTSERVARRILHRNDSGAMRFIEQPPVLTHVGDEIRDLVDRLLDQYSRTVPPDVALMLQQYRVVDVARRVVGVGSVGTRCFIVALADATEDITILQIKEANMSVVHEFGGISEADSYFDSPLLMQDHGYRVVSCQRVLQAVSDPFLGHLGIDAFHFYARLFRNNNASFELSEMTADDFRSYVRACAVVLARGHARSPQMAHAAGYLGSGSAFVRAVTEWAHQYADQAELDYAAFIDAARSGAFTL